jgi:hypothetical protein
MVGRSWDRGHLRYNHAHVEAAGEDRVHGDEVAGSHPDGLRPRKTRQVSEARRGEGGTPARHNTCHTVEAVPRTPSRISTRASLAYRTPSQAGPVNA